MINLAHTGIFSDTLNILFSHHWLQPIIKVFYYVREKKILLFYTLGNKKTRPKADQIVGKQVKKNLKFVKEKNKIVGRLFI
jgi:hypothetical protein